MKYPLAIHHRQTLNSYVAFFPDFPDISLKSANYEKLLLKAEDCLKDAQKQLLLFDKMPPRPSDKWIHADNPAFESCKWVQVEVPAIN
ncbi:hypothetical protein AB4254_11510 [Vibrio breoganii]